MMKNVIYLLIVLFLANCTNLAVKRTKPSAKINQALLADQDGEMTADDMEEALTRSDKIVGFRDGLVVEAALQTKALQRAKVKARIKKEAYKSKLSKEEEKKRLDKALSEINKKKSSTCFIVSVETNMGTAMQSKYWHGELSQGSKKSEVLFSEFMGFTTNRRSAIQSGNTINVFNNRRHHLFSMACAKMTVDQNGGDIVFVVEPRFEEGLNPLTLTWGDPGPKKVEGPGSCSSKVAKTPMKFGKLQLTCIDECTDRVHPLNQKKCQEQFERHLSKEN